MSNRYSRRRMLCVTGHAVLAGMCVPNLLLASNNKPTSRNGMVVGDVQGAKVGEQILAEGGNAVDAAVAAAFAAMIGSPSKCGPGGYGGSAMIALANGKVTCIDFNSRAPAAARPDMFPLDSEGNVKGRLNYHGWLAAGVPGTLGGMQMMIDRHGTKSLGELLQPAVAAAKASTKKDKFFDYGALANFLSTLAERNSTESFYRGDMAQEIADAFQKGGGLVTVKDLAAHRARELKPYEIEWNGFRILTAPLCATGVTALEALHFLKALKWEKRFKGLEAAHAKLEALRLAWKDRWDFFGDPEFVPVPIQKLLSKDYAEEGADKVREAVKARRPLSLFIERSEQLGTMNISAVDKAGNMVACTFTHGGGYGAKVTVESLGLVLGHGMSRFDPRPGKPNSVGPGKRPVHNMSPTVLLRRGKPFVAIGAAGGTKIPSAIYDFLTHFAGLEKSFTDAVDAPRLNTVGTMELRVEKAWPTTEKEFFKKLGYKIRDYPGAFVSAVSFDPKTGAMQARNHSGNPFQSGEEG